MGSLQLDMANNQTAAKLVDTIFHVFSEDFVHEELREQNYKIDGEIENQIAVDSTNIQIGEARDALSKAESATQGALVKFKAAFEQEKVAQLIGRAGVRRQLKEYNALSFESLIDNYTEKPQPLEENNFVDILKDLDSLKSLPDAPLYPETIDVIGLDDTDLSALAGSLNRITSPSTVSEEIKRKIDAHRDFYKAGVDLINQRHLASCPFCEQGLTASDPKAVIDAYVEYFSDEEEKHKAELRRYYSALRHKEKQIAGAEISLARQKSRYDTLKSWLPSMRETSLSQGESAVNAATEAIASLRIAIESKAKNLSAPSVAPDDDLAKRIGAINQVITDNNRNVGALSESVSKSDDERRSLQRRACDAFSREFAISRWPEIAALRANRNDLREKAAELRALEKSSPPTNARVRVADTFELLLKDFFGDKYVFDKDAFVIKRGVHEMARGPHRTLSDGEKTAIAFCYFVACVHRKVTANTDYRRLFMVFDDPVTSMSYDFVFAIAQTLKNLNIGGGGLVGAGRLKQGSGCPAASEAGRHDGSGYKGKGFLRCPYF